MSEGVWYRSLYWRIALGFILLLASVLIIQGAVFLWLLDRGESLPGPPPRGFTRIVALELSAALAANPDLDLQRFLRDTYQPQSYPFFVLMKDGRIASHGAPPPAVLVAGARARLEFGDRDLPRFGGTDRGTPPRPGRPDAPAIGPPRGRFGGPAGDIVVDGRLAGIVSTVPRTSLSQLGPAMAMVAIALVVSGTALASLLIFGPVRRRLRNLEETAQKVGAGDLTVRAREDGGDEVANLATAFNRMAADLGMRADQVHEADRARRLLLADVSHELRTPLTAMRGYLETLSMSELALDQETRARYMGIVSEETRRLEHIVGDLLDLAKLEGGGESFDLQDVPIEDLFGRVAARHERETGLKHVTLAVSIAPGAEIVYGDPMRLEQVLQNLAANALRHTPRGGRIELKAEIDGGDIVLSVRDSGPGIPAEHLPYVFERFYKTDPSRAQDAPGSGLGLSIVKAVVERHGGTIVVASRRNQGSLFTIRLPAAGAAGA
jgi:signal transduction histidine kinase